jgi:hypothetical protein
MKTNIKGTRYASTLSALVLAASAALVVGCTITTTPADPIPAPTPPSTTEDGGMDGAASASGCDFGEPNDTREQAKVIALGTAYTGLCVSNPDHTDELDFFEFTAPSSDLAGGVVEVQLTNVKNGGLAEIIVTAVANNGVVFDSYQTDPGANTSGWLSVAPGAKYRIQVNRFGGAGDRFAYDLLAKYTAITDTFEPNNKKEDAKVIALNTPIVATAAAHSANAELSAGDDQDWFKVSLGAGIAKIKMTNVAADYMCDVELLNDAGESVGEKYQVDRGADCVLDAQDLKAGSYFVKLHAFSGLPIRGDANKPVAAFMLQSYTLEVQQ